jgi:SAM-dependent methyltransferase
MNCKICYSPTIKITYILKNATVLVCSDCKFHFISAVDPILPENPEINEAPVSPELREYLKNQLQYNHKRFSNQVELILKCKEDVTGINILLQKRGANCFGIEPNIERLKYARTEEKLKNIFPIPVESPYWKDHYKHYFDIITIWDVLEHVNDPQALFENSKQLLKPDGLLFIDTPCRNTFFHKFGEISYKLSRGKYPTFLNIMYSNKPFEHKQIFSKSDIQFLCNKYQYKILKLDLIAELSFPIEYYVNKLFTNKNLVAIISKIISLLFKVFSIKNKMIIVAKVS